MSNGESRTPTPRERESTQQFVALDTMMRHVGKTLTPELAGKIAAEYVEEFRRGPCAWAFSSVSEKQGPLDAAGEPKQEATMLERLAVEALNDVKAWRDSDGNEAFPQATREKVDVVLMTYEQRRIQRPSSCPHAAPFVYCETCKADPCPLGLGDKGAKR